MSRVLAGPVLSPADTKRYSLAEMSPIDPTDATLVRCFNPSTGQMLGNIKVDTPDDVMRVVDDARAAQATWQTTSFAERRTVLRIMAQAVHKYRDDICKLAAAETGKTRELTVTLEGVQLFAAPSLWPACMCRIC